MHDRAIIVADGIDGNGLLVCGGEGAWTHKKIK